MRDAGGAKRQRRWRERRQAGRFLVSIEIDRELVDGLIDAGLLAEWDDIDAGAIAAAVLAAARRHVTRYAGDEGLLDRVCDDQPVGALVRSFAGAVPPDAKDGVQIVNSEIVHYLKPLVEKAVKCRKEIRSFKGE